MLQLGPPDGDVLCGQPHRRDLKGKGVAAGLQAQRVQPNRRLRVVLLVRIRLHTGGEVKETGCRHQEALPTVGDESTKDKPSETSYRAVERILHERMVFSQLLSRRQRLRCLLSTASRSEPLHLLKQIKPIKDPISYWGLWSASALLNESNECIARYLSACTATNQSKNTACNSNKFPILCPK